MTNAITLPKLVGERIKRREDPKLVSGLGIFVDDIKLPGMLHMHVVRSDRGHARILGVDTTAAKAAPGVALVMTGAEAKAWGEMLPTASNLGQNATRYPLNADGVVRFVGEGIAAVVASDRYVARDAADLIEVDYEELPAVVDALKAMEPGATLLHPDFGTNICISMPQGDKDATDAAFREADVVISQWMVNHRLIPNAMEPRGVVANYDPGLETLTVWSSTQVPHLLKSLLGRPRPHPGAQDPGNRAGGWRRLRLEDRRVPRGHHRAARQHQAGQAGEVDRDAAGELHHHDPRT